MKKYNRNKIRKADYGPGQRPAKHHSKKPFNPDRYGKLWKTIGYELRYGNQTPIGEANQPTMGSLLIDGKKFEVTWTEANRIIDSIRDLQNVYSKAKRMGTISEPKYKIEHGGVFQ
mgnify:CR=1 FL=1